ncbi:alpha/beta hydrolase [Sphingomonas sp. AP4-R1]|uniref:alpha/beta fold hydrolase n=1 Tax=Sphingomonas sp. AP4-R1 TaxID=2735134 RepID=UPI001493B7F9|nr:alpha/beta hydrolase [Sphingomonas sp. AP4-R1]QJU58666.1 alpha/beta hydrolase [Sphingomonas sp. AP4-R1]
MADPIPYDAHRIPSGAGEIYVRDYAGAGPALVLMHGFPDHLGIYDDLVPYLVAAGRRVVLFDFLGFGASDKPAGAQYSFAQQLGDLKTVVRALNLGTVALVPHDSSGIVGINFAIAHPEQVAGLYILNSAFDASPLAHWPEMIILFADPDLTALAHAIATDTTQFGWLLRWQQGRFAASLPPTQGARFESVIGPLIADNFIRQPGAGPAFAQMTAAFYAELQLNSGRLDLLQALDMPVKVIWGIADPYLTTAMGRERAARFRRGTFHPVAAGHWLQSDEPAQVAREILS